MLLLCLILAFASFCIASEDSIREAREKLAFSQFITKYQKSYSATEKLNRFKIFQDNLKIIEKQNQNSKHAKFGVNKFSDLSKQEFADLWLAEKIPAQSLATR